MKRILLILGVLLLAACGTNAEAEPDYPKEKISREETFNYLEELLDLYADLTEIETEEEAIETIEKIGETAQEVTRELKRDYDKDIHAVNDLLRLSEKLEELAQDVEDGNLHLMSAYGQDIGKHIRNVSVEHLDGDLPKKYGETVGADNIYDLE